MSGHSVLFLPAAIVLAALASTALGAEHYVDFTYSGPETGTSAQPFNTLNEATSAAALGDTVYIKGGDYSFTAAEATERLRIRNFARSCPGCDAAPSNMLTIAPEPGAQVTLRAAGQHDRDMWRIVDSDRIHVAGGGRFSVDGGLVPFGSDDALVHLSNTTNAIVAGLEVGNSRGRGITYSQVGSNTPRANIEISDNHVHHIYHRAIGGYANGVLIESNLVHDTTLSNAGRDTTWSGAIVAGPHWQTGAGSQDAVIRGNTVHNVFGEGILTNGLRGGEIYDNVVYNTYAARIYLDKSRDVLVNGNYLYHNDPAYFRDGAPSNGVSIANEFGNPLLDYAESAGNIRITNNLIIGAKRGIGFWFDGTNPHLTNTYEGIDIFHNVIKDVTARAIHFDLVPFSHLQPQAAQVRNNVLYGGLFIGNEAAWTFANNNWVNGIPTGGLIDHLDSLAGSAGFVGTDFELIAGADPDLFKLGPSSQNTGSGSPTSTTGVTVDYWGMPFNGAAPAIGLHAAGAPASQGVPEPAALIGSLGLGLTLITAARRRGFRRPHGKPA